MYICELVFVISMLKQSLILKILFSTPHYYRGIMGAKEKNFLNQRLFEHRNYKNKIYKYCLSSAHPLPRAKGSH